MRQHPYRLPLRPRTRAWCVRNDPNIEAINIDIVERILTVHLARDANDGASVGAVPRCMIVCRQWYTIVCRSPVGIVKMVLLRCTQWPRAIPSDYLAGVAALRTAVGFHSVDNTISMSEELVTCLVYRLEQQRHEHGAEWYIQSPRTVSRAFGLVERVRDTFDRDRSREFFDILRMRTNMTIGDREAILRAMHFLFDEKELLWYFCWCLDDRKWARAIMVALSQL